MASQPKMLAWGRVCPHCSIPAYDTHTFCEHCGREAFEPESSLHTYEIFGRGQFVLYGDPQAQVPLKLIAKDRKQTEAEYWVCENRVFIVLGAHLVPEQELLLQIQHAALKEEKTVRRIRRGFQAFHNSKRSKSARRERIPDDVRLYVWQRDEGKCVQCSSQEKLEYDHIIPVSKGGSNTDRNIRLLCETCNRQKGQMI
jgi:hypothetical protein